MPFANFSWAAICLFLPATFGNSIPGISQCEFLSKF
jgi:hypothetical protein